MDEIAGVNIAGVENDGGYCMVYNRHCRNGQEDLAVASIARDVVVV